MKVPLYIDSLSGIIFITVLSWTGKRLRITSEDFWKR